MNYGKMVSECPASNTVVSCGRLSVAAIEMAVSIVGGRPKCVVISPKVAKYFKDGFGAYAKGWLGGWKNVRQDGEYRVEGKVKKYKAVVSRTIPEDVILVVGGETNAVVKKA